MTKQEAIEAMKAGLKVTHRYFSDDEFISMKDGKIVIEEGYSFDDGLFWKCRQAPAFEQDWSIFQKNKMEVIRKVAVSKVVHRLAISEEYQKVYSLMDEIYKSFDKKINRKKATLINWRLRKYKLLGHPVTLEYGDIYKMVNGREDLTQPIGMEIHARRSDQPGNKVWICNFYHIETMFSGNDAVLFPEDKVKAVMTFKYK